MVSVGSVRLAPLVCVLACCASLFLAFIQRYLDPNADRLHLRSRPGSFTRFPPGSDAHLPDQSPLTINLFPPLRSPICILHFAIARPPTRRNAR